MGVCCSKQAKNGIKKVEPDQYMVYSNEYADISENDFNMYKSEFLKMNIEKNNPALQNLTKAQLQKLFEKYKINIPQTSISGLIQLVDQNKNGVLEFDEFISLMAKLSKNDMNRNASEIVYTTKSGLEVTKIQFELYKSSFDYYDIDKDNYLNCQEFISLLKGTRRQLYAQDLLYLNDVVQEFKEEEIVQYKEFFEKTTFDSNALLNLDKFITIQLQQKDLMKLTSRKIENNAILELDDLLN